MRVPRLLKVPLAIGVGGLLWRNLVDRLGEHGSFGLVHVWSLEASRLLQVGSIRRLAMICDVGRSIHLLWLLLPLWDRVALLLSWLTLILRRHRSTRVE